MRERAACSVQDSLGSSQTVDTVNEVPTDIVQHCLELGVVIFNECSYFLSHLVHHSLSENVCHCCCYAFLPRGECGAVLCESGPVLQAQLTVWYVDHLCTCYTLLS